MDLDCDNLLKTVYPNLQLINDQYKTISGLFFLAITYIFFERTEQKNARMENALSKLVFSQNCKKKQIFFHFVP